MNNMKRFLASFALLGLCFEIGVMVSHRASAQSGAVSVATAFSCYPTGPLACTKVEVNSSTTPFPATSICLSPSDVGSSNSFRSRIVTNIGSISQANPAVITSNSHGFPLNTLPVVTISGVTGTGYSGINNTWVATVTGANTFTVPFNSGALGAPTAAGSYTTTAPRTNVAEWAVQIFKLDANQGVIGAFWQGNAIAGTNSPAGPANAFMNKCSDVGGSTIPVQ